MTENLFDNLRVEELAKVALRHGNYIHDGGSSGIHVRNEGVLLEHPENLSENNRLDDVIMLPTKTQPAIVIKQHH